MKPFRLLCLTFLVSVIFMTGCSGLEATPAPIIPTPTPAPTSSPMPLPPPTTLLEPKLYAIDIARLEEVPQDLLEQIYRYQSGAGGGCYGQEQLKPPVWIDPYAGAVNPAIPTSLSWTLKSYSKSPTPEAWLTLPDGSKVQTELLEDEDGCYVTSYPIAPGSLLGTYTLKITQGGFMIQDSVTLEFPSKPIWTAYQGNIWYAGFKPGEQVTLHICEYLYISWRNGLSLSDLAGISQSVPGTDGSVTSVCGKIYTELIAADEYGTFQVHVPDDYWVDAQANDSGVKTTIPTCGDLIPTQLILGGFAEMDHNITSREITGFTQDGEGASIPLGTKVKTVFGPICNPYLSRWEWIVETPDQMQLWVSENQNHSRLLVPVNP
jgi:hypothetical protein